MSERRPARLLEACNRLLRIELEVMRMEPAEVREWFFRQAGHKDCFDVARALKERLELELSRMND